MSAPAVTPWFPADVKPVRVGRYQRKYDNPKSTEVADYWDGMKWFAVEQSGKMNLAWLDLEWRGLAQDPNAATPESVTPATRPQADPTKLQPGRPSILSLAHGKYLDALAATSGIKRKRWLLVFKESDGALRARIRRSLFRGWVGVVE